MQAGFHMARLNTEFTAQAKRQQLKFNQEREKQLAQEKREKEKTRRKKEDEASELIANSLLGLSVAVQEGSERALNFVESMKQQDQVRASIVQGTECDVDDGVSEPQVTNHISLALDLEEQEQLLREVEEEARKRKDRRVVI